MLQRFQTDYIDIGMIHYIDQQKDFETIFNGPIIKYALELKEKGVIRHIGISSHNPLIAIEAVKTGLVDVILFSINPCYDLLHHLKMLMIYGMMKNINSHYSILIQYVRIYTNYAKKKEWQLP